MPSGIQPASGHLNGLESNFLMRASCSLMENFFGGCSTTAFSSLARDRRACFSFSDSVNGVTKAGVMELLIFTRLLGARDLRYGREEIFCELRSLLG